MLDYKHSENTRRTTKSLFAEYRHSAKKKHTTYPLFADCVPARTQQRRRTCPPHNLLQLLHMESWDLVVGMIMVYVMLVAICSCVCVS